MKFITEPSVELISYNLQDTDQLWNFLNDNCPDLARSYIDRMKHTPIELIETAGRTCYMSFGKGRPHDEYIKHIIESGHGSVLEHVNFTFQIWGISRSLSHELVRHRAGMAYSQLSQRYVDSSDVNFIVPLAIQALGQEEQDRWKDFCSLTVNEYSHLVDILSDPMIEDKTERRKKARQAARSVLPNATETIMTVTMNARAFRHFVEMRANAAAEVEIRALAIKVFDIINERWPLICHGMEKEILQDGSYGIKSQFRKV